MRKNWILKQREIMRYLKNVLVWLPTFSMTTPFIISTFFRHLSSSLIIKHLTVSGWVQMIHCKVFCCWFIFALTWQASCGSDEATAKYDLNQQSCVQTHSHVCIKGQFFLMFHSITIFTAFRHHWYLSSLTLCSSLFRNVAIVMESV